MVSRRPSQNKKEKNKGRQNKKVKMVCNCLRMMDLDTRERLPINAFLSIFPFSTDFSAFLLPTTCLLLGIYFSPLHIRHLLLRYCPMTSKKEIPNKTKNCKGRNNHISAFHSAAQMHWGRSGEGGNLSDSGQVVGHVGKVTIIIAYNKIVESREFFMI